MSRSTPDIQNPSQHFFKWSGSKGELAFYNKETKENVPVKLPFEFLVLDQLSTVTGYSETDSSGFWSNEVKLTSTQPLTVKTKKGTVATGLYRDIKDTIKSKGAKFASSVYIAHKSKNGYIIGNLQVSGAALSPWIDLNGTYKLDNGKVVLTGSTEGKKGATVYQIPTFEYVSSSKEEDAEAITLDKQLQDYLKHYFESTQTDYMAEEEVDHSPIDSEVGRATPEQIAQFEKLKADKLNKKPLEASDFPDDEAQSLYNSVAQNEFTDDDIPPEFR